MPAELRDYTRNTKLNADIKDTIQLCQPESVYICTGTQEEYDRICQQMVDAGTFVRLNPAKRENCYLAHSDPGDVARVEDRTYICSLRKEDAGPTNNWMDPAEMNEKLRGLMSGCMRGRTLYVVPFSMGHVQSPFRYIGVELTDSPYVVVNMKIMTRMGQEILDAMGVDGDYVHCLHSVGYPLNPGQKDVAWPCDATHKYITHFPEKRSIISYGSGYGGNALLGKKCFALRIASAIGRDEGWLAEHMLITGVTSPSGEKKYMCGAFPSACGKTNLAMVEARLPGWKIETVGDDIAWLRIGPDGRLWAINPESGFFGVAPGTNPHTNRNALESCRKDTIFTNVGLTPDGDVWWEGLSDHPPAGTINWLGQVHNPDSKEKVAHPNARFTAPTVNCPVLDPAFNNALQGVPIDVILFGGRRSTLVPVVRQSFDWKHGVFLGASCCSETTTANQGATVGIVRHDPFAMLPFCGYNMGDYFKHWLSFEQRTEASKLPKIFFVNWFRKGPHGEFLWPGFSDNLRIIEWIFSRCNNQDNFIPTPIGNVPRIDSVNMEGLQGVDLSELTRVNVDEWITEMQEIHGYLNVFGDHLAEGVKEELKLLEERLTQSKAKAVN